MRLGISVGGERREVILSLVTIRHSVAGGGSDLCGWGSICMVLQSLRRTLHNSINSNR